MAQSAAIQTGDERYSIRPLNPSPELYFPNHETLATSSSLRPIIRLSFLRCRQNMLHYPQQDDHSPPAICMEAPKSVTAVLDYSLFSDPTNVHGAICNYLIGLDITRQAVHSAITSSVMSMVRNHPFPIMDNDCATFAVEIDVVREFVILDHYRVDAINYQEEEERVLAESAANSNIGMVGASKGTVFKALKIERMIGEDGHKTGESCSICMDDLPSGAYVSKMPCHHQFHGQCIVKWLRTSHFCPVCRFEIPI